MIIGLSGYAQTGKDTVAEYLVNVHNFTRVAFADPIREAVYTLDPIIEGTKTLSSIIDIYGWEQSKKIFPEVRRLIQRFGTEVGRMMWGENFWVDKAFEKINAIDGPVVVTDVRFINEADAIRKSDGRLWRIVRDSVGPVNYHLSETELDNHLFDVTIENNVNLSKLYSVIDELL